MNNSFTPGKIIIINGPSSSGKTTLALAAQKQFDVPFIRFSFDLFLDAHSLPIEQMRNGIFSWEAMRPSVFSGLHQCMAALAKTGNNLICDHIIESRDWLHDLLHAVSGLDVFFVGLHCSLEELERREIQRGNRGSGDAQRDLEFVHQFTSYDLELDSENPLDENVRLLVEAWQQRKHPSALDKMMQDINVGT